MTLTVQHSIVLIARSKGRYVEGFNFSVCGFLGLGIRDSSIWNEPRAVVVGCNRAALPISKYFVGPTLSPPLVYLEDLHCLPDAAS